MTWKWSPVSVKTLTLWIQAIGYSFLVRGWRWDGRSLSWNILMCKVLLSYRMPSFMSKLNMKIFMTLSIWKGLSSLKVTYLPLSLPSFGPSENLRLGEQRTGVPWAAWGHQRTPPEQRVHHSHTGPQRQPFTRGHRPQQTVYGSPSCWVSLLLHSNFPLNSGSLWKQFYIIFLRALAPQQLFSGLISLSLSSKMFKTSLFSNIY